MRLFSLALLLSLVQIAGARSLDAASVEIPRMCPRSGDERPPTIPVCDTAPPVMLEGLPAVEESEDDDGSDDSGHARDGSVVTLRIDQSRLRRSLLPPQSACLLRGLPIRGPPVTFLT